MQETTETVKWNRNLFKSVTNFPYEIFLYENVLKRHGPIRGYTISSGGKGPGGTGGLPERPTVPQWTVQENTFLRPDLVYSSSFQSLNFKSDVLFDCNRTWTHYPFQVSETPCPFIQSLTPLTPDNTLKSRVGLISPTRLGGYLWKSTLSYPALYPFRVVDLRSVWHFLRGTVRVPKPKRGSSPLLDDFENSGHLRIYTQPGEATGGPLVYPFPLGSESSGRVSGLEPLHVCGSGGGKKNKFSLK